MAHIFEIVFLILALILLFWQVSLFIAVISGAPTVDAQDSAIIGALKLAKLKKDESVLDLGCSDGRALIIAAERFSAKGIGIEISPFYYIKAKLKLLVGGQRSKIDIKFGNLKNNLKMARHADVVYLYLFPKLLDEIEEELFANAKEGGRIVTVGFKFKKHQARTNSKVINHNRQTSVYLYRV